MKNNKNIVVFTDGACSGNGKRTAKGGIGIHFPNGEYDDISKKFTESPITNQRAELYAIQSAINILKDEVNEITIYSDSLYSIKSLTEWINKWKNNNWKNSVGSPVKNLDLIRPIYQSMENKKIKFIHVRSHTGKQTFGAIGNDKADKLACEGALL